MKSKNMRLALGLATSVVALGAMTGSALAVPTVTPTVAPTLSGTTELDAAGNLRVYSVVKMATPTTRTTTGGSFTRYIYSWHRSTSSNPGNLSSDWTTISGANGAWYQVKRADVGFKVRLRVRVCYSDGTEACTSSSTTPNLNWSSPTPVITHANTGAPALSNTSPPYYGRTIWAGEGVWDGTFVDGANKTWSYQWEACASAVVNSAGTPTSVSDCANVDSGDTSSVTLKPSNCTPVKPGVACTQPTGPTIKAFAVPAGKYIGKYLRCKITLTQNGLAVSSYTNATKAVYDPTT